MLLDDIVELAKELGEFVKSELRKKRKLSVAFAENGAPDVYDIDLAAEAFLRKYLEKTKMPVVAISEDSEIFRPKVKPEAALIVDPLDGSSNAVRNIPVYTTSIALGSLDLINEFSFRNVFAGVVYFPVSGDCYVAERGKGATLNGSVLKARHVLPLKKSYAGAIFKLPSAFDLGILSFFKSFRCFGCATEHLCALSRGDYGAYFAFDDKLRVYDIAAAGCILIESGGVITDLNGMDLVASPTDKVNFVASSNCEMHEGIINALIGHKKGR